MFLKTHFVSEIWNNRYCQIWYHLRLGMSIITLIEDKHYDMNGYYIIKKEFRK